MGLFINTKNKEHIKKIEKAEKELKKNRGYYNRYNLDKKDYEEFVEKVKKIVIDELGENEDPTQCYAKMITTFKKELKKEYEPKKDILLKENEVKSNKKINKQLNKQTKKQKRIGTIHTINGIEFQCSIRQNRLGAFGDYDGNILDANCIIKKDRLIIKKSSVITKRSLGDETIFFKNIISMDYQKGDIMQINNNLIIQTNGFGIIRLEYVKDPQYNALNRAWQKFINKPAEPIAVKPVEPIVNNTSAADEIDKWFSLYEKGAITKEEFEAKKKELL